MDSNKKTYTCGLCRFFANSLGFANIFVYYTTDHSALQDTPVSARLTHDLQYFAMSQRNFLLLGGNFHKPFTNRVIYKIALFRVLHEKSDLYSQEDYQHKQEYWCEGGDSNP